VIRLSQNFPGKVEIKSTLKKTPKPTKKPKPEKSDSPK